eukprot:CAMPEP_0206139638 /NCGR_PEP_ID=MMETSP1473-20131121/6809_1 /ASSEMBLY_ACC=CAM_ASM_001109 /TAXON_ID=1461547 /ORGANISM="Stichococcus sp, Strain RCC1054" /LENGTH=246 /DNA_ID=CAMNT_0053533511 /DNA_START=111 /DNA_END=851 /DNA_ORIENTATION=+
MVRQGSRMLAAASRQIPPFYPRPRAFSIVASAANGHNGEAAQTASREAKQNGQKNAQLQRQSQGQQKPRVARRSPSGMMSPRRQYDDSFLAPFSSSVYLPGFGRIGSFLRSIDDEMNAMMQGMPDVPDEVSSMSGAALAVDIHDEPDAYELKADVPGLSKSDVKVKMLPGNVLSISGERTIEQKGGDEDRAASYERRFFGSFQRSFRLPDNVDMENISAKVEHGVLDIRVPKKQKEQAVEKEITIN